MDVVMNFIALGVIAEIDDFYAGSLNNFTLKGCIEEPPKITRTSKFYLSHQRGKF